eukprot:c7441_g1_i1.p1 GENE.c7441_g1_i1~~c7441_g1_i1.p1  ORF type:complete len:356 (+),score=57.48 c7441_g1_i1:52-1068(+)
MATSRCKIFLGILGLVLFCFTTPIINQHASLGLLAKEIPAMNTTKRERLAYFHEFFGPPGLKKNWFGKWTLLAKDKDLVCAVFRYVGHYQIPLVINGPAVNSKVTHRKSAKGPAFQSALQKVPENAIVFFTDSKDSVFLASEQEFHRRFVMFETRLGFSPILVSTERNCWRYPDCDTYAPSNSSFRFVNSGAFASRNTPNLHRFIDAWVKCVAAGVDDQECIHYFFMKHPNQTPFLGGQPAFENVALDTNCELFQSGHSTMLETFIPGLTPERERNIPWIVNGEFVNPETQTKPILVHYNSDGRKVPDHANQVLSPNDDWREHVIVVWDQTLRLGELC